MSGIVGIVDLGGGGVDGRLLERMTRDMAFRGPDAQRSWTDGRVGLGHARLATSATCRGELQPTCLEGRFWITADARLDGRAELCRQLAASGRGDLLRCPDAELILHAYAVWGDGLLDRLLGDFAFAIWDAPRQRLLCARDHFGVKPLFWGCTPRSLVFGNTVDSLASCPALVAGIDGAAIADFLLFGVNLRVDRSALSGIAKLPPAHVLTWSPGRAPATRRYWSLRVDHTVRFRRPQEHVERFLALLREAVHDRLRGQGAAVLMSGGLDSTSVAWAASDVLGNGGGDLQALTFVYDRLVPDDERDYSRLVAERLGIALHHVALDGEGPEDFWGEGRGRSPEPLDVPLTDRTADLPRRLAPDVRVGLTGQGGDPALGLSATDFLDGLKRGNPLRSLAELVGYRRRHGRLPRLGLRTGLKNRLQRRPRGRHQLYPPWLNPDFEARFGLHERWQASLAEPEYADVPRPRAQHDLQAPVWPAVFERYDAGVTGLAAELRHPYFDRRLVEHLLSVPPVPWCVDKELLRVAMHGRLPEAVRRRPKGPLAGFPVFEQLRRGSIGPCLELVESVPRLGEFVDVARFLEIATRPHRLRPAEYGLISRPLGLARWLHERGAGGAAANPGG